MFNDACFRAGDHHDGNSGAFEFKFKTIARFLSDQLWKFVPTTPNLPAIRVGIIVRQDFKTFLRSCGVGWEELAFIVTGCIEFFRHRMGGYRIQGRDDAQAQQLMADAQAVAEAGACAIVLEGIPAALGSAITEALTIPTIGIGAGVDCDGQVLVIHDILGLCEKYSPKFVKRYADISTTIRQGIDSYILDVKEQRFPGPEHSF